MSITTLKHDIPQITLTGPTAGDTYQENLTLTPLASSAHGSDFMTTPIATFISKYAPPNKVSVTNPDVTYTTPAVTTPTSYAKTRSVFDHYDSVKFADSLH
jgi:hypothetical protein